ncbi:DUF262 domain-containing protein [Pseudomonas aeruginosa]|uniref:DUF262 domain-containing protein n=1 Tax=Pseudomonas aeruginosa TaxID=287 RepID=UPI00265E6D5A|nr:DUF262 domain-containing protein [Pseudomonas aeruginosa]
MDDLKPLVASFMKSRHWQTLRWRNVASVQTQVQSAALLCEQGIALTIPSYQRPYEHGQSAQPQYFIGTVLSSQVALGSSSAAVMTYELIDGQQRMTTLMVLALAFCALVPDSPLRSLVVLGNVLRLTFNIREEVQARLSAWVGLIEDIASDEKDAQNPYLKHLCAAHKAACDRLKKLQLEKGREAVQRVSKITIVCENASWSVSWAAPGSLPGGPRERSKASLAGFLQLSVPAWVGRTTQMQDSALQSCEQVAIQLLDHTH